MMARYAPGPSNDFSGRLRLLFLDIDSALLSREQKLPRRVSEAIKKLKGHKHVILTSTRPLRTVLSYAGMLGLKAPVAALNGAVIADVTGHEYRRESLPLKPARRLMDHVDQCCELTLSVHGGGIWYVSRSNQLVWDEMEIASVSAREAGPEELLQLPRIDKMSLMYRPGDEDTVSDIAQAYAGELRMEFSRPGCLEITAPQVSRKNAAAFIARELGGSLTEGTAVAEWAASTDFLRSYAARTASEEAVPPLAGGGGRIVSVSDFVDSHFLSA